MILADVVPEEILFTGSADAKARCFNTHFGDLTTTFGNHRDTVSSMHYSEAIREWDSLIRGGVLQGLVG